MLLNFIINIILLWNLTANFSRSDKQIMTIAEYVDNINRRYKTGISREHSYRGDLQTLLESLVTDVLVTNEPARIACGAPDYVITRKDVPVGFIEAKDIGIDLGSKTLKEQFDRYKASLDNLIFTDYLDFHLYIDGEFVTSIKIAEIQGDSIVPITKNHEQFKSFINDFCVHVSQTIKSSSKLSKMMAGKAKMLSQVLEKALIEDESDTLNPDTALQQQMNAFKEILIHDITPKGFADIYAQTIAYGMFAARLHDPTLDTFSRQEAAELIPKSNPFLRKLFQFIAGYDLDNRIVWIVDSLADIFRATNVDELLKNFGKSTQMHDPIIHFYENFLAEYDPKLRKARGVWYTPEPVVDFIVRAVDDILKTEFSLSQGLADTSKTKIKVNTQNPDKRTKERYRQEEKEIHKVQVLDAGTGTGTFLSQVVKQVYKNFEGQEGIWSNYVENHLIPRLNGFEILMASYAMAHLKLDMLLTETGYKPSKEQRFKIYLTNSLEKHHPDTGTLFSNWLSTEANEANQIKRDNPVMCVIGNPPYSGESSNKGDWIMGLMDDYKKEPGGKVKLQERNPKWINDDYVKFMRYGQHYIEKNGEGILAFINPHGYLDNPTFRGMRWNLMKTYDKLYVIDLHGNSKKKEVAPDGSPDVNVFDIMQGVSINIFVKTGNKKSAELGKVYHYDLFGKRDVKYDFLWKNSLKSIPFSMLPNKAPNFFMVPKDFETEDEYNKGFSVTELFPVNSVGIVTARDKFTIRDSKTEVSSLIEDFVSLEVEEARTKYSLGNDARDWKVHYAQNDLKESKLSPSNICKISYRLFDDKWTYYTGKSKGFHCMPRGNVMKHFFKKENIGLNICKQFKAGNNYYHCFISNKMIESSYVSNKTGEITSSFPLYLYSDEGQGLIDGNKEKTPNLNKEIISNIEGNINMSHDDEQIDIDNYFSSLNLLDYIYAILHSPSFRKKYSPFLKIGFPRISYPKNKDIFWQLVNLGSQIRLNHLMESDEVDNYITTYPKNGDNTITRRLGQADWELYDSEKQLGKIWINDEQFFDKIPLKAWEFHIGGYQPAQKWLKDRRERELSFEDIIHYQKIIVVLNETDKLMQEIDKIEIE